MTIDARDFVRPRTGTWLYKSASRVIEILQDEYHLVGFDPDLTFLTIAQELRETRDHVALAMHVQPAAAQNYIDESTLRRKAQRIAETLADENPGADPFADTNTVRLHIAAWVRASWSLQIAAAATRSDSAEYAESMADIVMSMTGLLSRQLESETELPTFDAPAAAAAYVARTLTAAAIQIEVWGSAVEGMKCRTLVDGLRSDADIFERMLAVQR